MIAGDRFGALAATEPNSGSNPFAISTRAASDSDEFIVNGNKIFITGADEAEVYLVVLRSDSAGAPAEKRP